MFSAAICPKAKPCRNAEDRMRLRMQSKREHWAAVSLGR